MAKKVKEHSDLPRITPTELAHYVKNTLMIPPNKGIIFGSFAREMAEDFESFLKHCKNQILEVKKLQLENKIKSVEMWKKDIEKLEAEIKEAEKE
jgi:hypothetical protein